jgi:hypothetical protein
MQRTDRIANLIVHELAEVVRGVVEHDASDPELDPEERNALAHALSVGASDLDWYLWAYEELHDEQIEA